MEKSRTRPVIDPVVLLHIYPQQTKIHSKKHMHMINIYQAQSQQHCKHDTQITTTKLKHISIKETD